MTIIVSLPLRYASLVLRKHFEFETPLHIYTTFNALWICIKLGKKFLSTVVGGDTFVWKTGCVRHIVPSVMVPVCILRGSEAGSYVRYIKYPRYLFQGLVYRFKIFLCHVTVHENIGVPSVTECPFRYAICKWWQSKWINLFLLESLGSYGNWVRLQWKNWSIKQ